MFETTLATTADAGLILKLYELRTEATMREARAWITGQFLPRTAEEFFAVMSARGTKENAWLRQVTSYWEMAAAFVLHGALNADLFVDCNSEPFYIYAKFLPILPEIRQKTPAFLAKLGLVIDQSPTARAKVEEMAKKVAAIQAATPSEKKYFASQNQG
ncbi:MAG TPA: hypothetical protein VE178_18910 [Silvibacterium sp.]|jgi:hypothetical protein|nr:hypothetical protein [Silvibacterium sp.]